jgi:A/G-specific adenine glycosylase
MTEETVQYVIKAGNELSGHRIAETELPWRRYRTPYRIFLAEMLLVRTRTDVVARLFESICARYPNVDTLASADENELREVLRPLGLSKRVPFFIKAARYIVDIHNGEIPSQVEDLLKIPGMGAYTAPAVATFAYGRGLVPADVNILRFVSRFTGFEMKHLTKGSQELRELLPLLSERNVGLSAENLLDFTRLTCRARKPRCVQCPISENCVYFQHSDKQG